MAGRPFQDEKERLAVVQDQNELSRRDLVRRYREYYRSKKMDVRFKIRSRLHGNEKVYFFKVRINKLKLWKRKLLRLVRSALTLT